MKIIFDDTATIPLTHPTTGIELFDSKKKPMSITIYSSQSQTFKDIESLEMNKRLTENKDQTAEGINEKKLNLYRNCTISFDNMSELELMGGVIGDKPNIKEVYRDNRWLQDFLDKHIYDKKNFLIEG